MSNKRPAADQCLTCVTQGNWLCDQDKKFPCTRCTEMNTVRVTKFVTCQTTPTTIPEWHQTRGRPVPPDPRTRGVRAPVSGGSGGYGPARSGERGYAPTEIHNHFVVNTGDDGRQYRSRDYERDDKDRRRRHSSSSDSDRDRSRHGRRHGGKRRSRSPQMSRAEKLRYELWKEEEKERKKNKEREERRRQEKLEKEQWQKEQLEKEQWQQKQWEEEQWQIEQSQQQSYGYAPAGSARSHSRAATAYSEQRGRTEHRAGSERGYDDGYGQGKDAHIAELEAGLSARRRQTGGERDPRVTELEGQLKEAQRANSRMAKGWRQDRQTLLAEQSVARKALDQSGLGVQGAPTGPRSASRRSTRPPPPPFPRDRTRSPSPPPQHMEVDGEEEENEEMYRAHDELENFDTDNRPDPPRPVLVSASAKSKKGHWGPPKYVEAPQPMVNQWTGDLTAAARPESARTEPETAPVPSAPATQVTSDNAMTQGIRNAASWRPRNALHAGKLNQAGGWGPSRDPNQDKAQ
ncbi:hypothetical protein LTR85_010146 [Meristemomyces frigidus]|nr:hypothetical protein LTR85_010146 [Meristemomyces frigidus]